MTVNRPGSGGGTTTSSWPPWKVDWFNHRRLHGANGDIPPIEYEFNHYRPIAGLPEEQPAAPSLH
jgi:hypothetical protein